VLDEILFEGADLSDKQVTISLEYVDRMLTRIIESEDLSKYIL